MIHPHLLSDLDTSYLLDCSRAGRQWNGSRAGYDDKEQCGSSCMREEEYATGWGHCGLVLSWAGACAGIDADVDMGGLGSGCPLSLHNRCHFLGVLTPPLPRKSRSF